ncbi:MAG TPA: glycosyltransferase family A protein [Pyrinomonadaceae bacterium]
MSLGVEQQITFMGDEAKPSSPAVSVVMPVHNALPYLDESIRSILGQTFDDFEFVILDDASTDGTTEKLREWAQKDARIRLYRSERKLGLSGSSNAVVALARAALVARMDADDISHPERLARQWEVMRDLPDVALVGTLFRGIDAAGRLVRPRDRWRLLRRSPLPPFPHGSVMLRRAAFDKTGGYSEECTGGEDQDLFLRMARSARVVVLTDVLYHYRFHAGCTSLDFLLARAAGSNGLQPQASSAAISQQNGGANGSHSSPNLRALRSACSLKLWAGQRPDALRMLLKSGALGLNVEAIYTLLWAVWGRLSPGSLKTCLRCLIRARDLLAGRRLRDGGVYEWRFE